MVKMYSPILRVYLKKDQQRTSNDTYAMFFCFCFLNKSICCGYSLELHRQVDAIQMGPLNICLHKEVDKKYTGCNLKTMELLNCALKGYVR